MACGCSGPGCGCDPQGIALGTARFSFSGPIGYTPNGARPLGNPVGVSTAYRSGIDSIGGSSMTGDVVSPIAHLNQVSSPMPVVRSTSPSWARISSGNGGSSLVSAALAGLRPGEPVFAIGRFLPPVMFSVPLDPDCPPRSEIMSETGPTTTSFELSISHSGGERMPPPTSGDGRRIRPDLDALAEARWAAAHPSLTHYLIERVDESTTKDFTRTSYGPPPCPDPTGWYALGSPRPTKKRTKVYEAVEGSTLRESEMGRAAEIAHEFEYEFGAHVTVVDFGSRLTR